MLLKLDELLFSRLFIGEAVSSTFSLDPNGFKRYYCFTDADHDKLVQYPVIELKTNMFGQTNKKCVHSIKYRKAELPKGSRFASTIVVQSILKFVNL